MNIAVDPVLELLDEKEIPMPPKQILLVLRRDLTDPPSRTSVMRALDSLKKHGFVEQPEDTTYYEITERGRKYLNGEIDASDLEDD